MGRKVSSAQRGRQGIGIARLLENDSSAINAARRKKSVEYKEKEFKTYEDLNPTCETKLKETSLILHLQRKVQN